MPIPIYAGDNPIYLEQAAQTLQAGQLVALPTETVYGLGADADQDNACRAIFAAKGRPTNHPLIVHVSSTTAAAHYAREIPDFAQQLIRTYWPGPLTIIVKRRVGIANAAAAGQDTIGLRCPAHPVAQALLKAFEHLGGHGIAAPSANQFGRTSPTTARHVQEAFADKHNCAPAMILDGGACEVGIESTIIDCSSPKMVLLRPGILTPDELEKAAGKPLEIADIFDETTPKAPGTLPSHYAPKAKIRLMSGEEIRTALGIIGSVKPTKTFRLGVYAKKLTQKQKIPHILTRPMPESAASVAHELFAVLHDFDAQGVDLIWIEKPPEEDPQWIGVIDRLERAAAS